MDASKQYEESIEKLHHQLASGALSDSISFRMESWKESSPGVEVADESAGDALRRESFYQIAVPPGLGPISLNGDKAYVQRHWPEELAVLDMGDLRQAGGGRIRSR